MPLEAAPYKQEGCITILARPSGGLSLAKIQSPFTCHPAVIIIFNIS